MTNSNPESPVAPTQAATPSNFLRDIIAEDVRTKKYGDAVIQTRFPPEPNGYSTSATLKLSTSTSV
jgi:hypothetical protein